MERLHFVSGPEATKIVNLVAKVARLDEHHDFFLASEPSPVRHAPKTSEPQWAVPAPT